MSSAHQESKENQAKGQIEFAGPFAKATFDFSHENKRDRLRVTLYDHTGRVAKMVLVGTRVSPFDDAVLMTALDEKGALY